jgi:hypothetical protein
MCVGVLQGEFSLYYVYIREAQVLTLGEGLRDIFPEEPMSLMIPKGVR